MPGRSLEGLLGHAAGEKLSALSWNRDPREIKTQRRSRSAGAQSALGTQLAHERVFLPALRHLADRITSRLRAKSLSGHTVTVRVRFADLRAVTRSTTFDTPIPTSAALAEIAEKLVRGVLAQYRHKPKISLLGIRVSHLTRESDLQLALPFGSDDKRRGRSAGGDAMRCAADRAVDTIRERFGWEAIGYGSVVLGSGHAVPDAFRELAEREL